MISLGITVIHINPHYFRSKGHRRFETKPLSFRSDFDQVTGWKNSQVAQQLSYGCFLKGFKGNINQQMWSLMVFGDHMI